MALAALYRLGPTRVSEIANHLAVDMSVASRQIQVLQRTGYVERRPDPEDGRAQLLSLSESGLEALRESHQRMIEVATCALADWNASEVTELVGGLERLRVDFDGENISTPGTPSPSGTPSPEERAAGAAGGTR